MATLHTLNKPPSNTELLAQLVNALEDEDSVVLLEDGVYHTLSISESDHALSKAKTIYMIANDSLARGIQSTSPLVSSITYEEFVDLTVTHDKVISWY